MKTKRDASQRIATTGWLEINRGRRPKSESWPKAAQKFSSSTTRLRRPPSVPIGGNERGTPEEALQAARARVAKLEAAVSAVGESDPTFPALQEALRQARQHAQVQPLERVFGGAKKRVENARKEVEDAKAKVDAAEMTLTSEVRALQDGEQRHASLWRRGCQRSHRPRCPWISQLVAELQREREELRSELGQRGVATPPEEGPPRKSTGRCQHQASDLMVPHNQLAISGGSSRNPSVLMETLIDGGSATLGWMTLPRTPNLLPRCPSRLRVCSMCWSKICTRFHEVFGADGSDCIGKLHRCGIEKHEGLSNWCAIWL